jgi:hypothetical protein
VNAIINLRVLLIAGKLLSGYRPGGLSSSAQLHSVSIVTLYRSVTHKQKQTPWPLVRERTIPTDRPPLVDEI